MGDRQSPDQPLRTDPDGPAEAGLGSAGDHRHRHLDVPEVPRDIGAVPRVPDPQRQSGTPDRAELPPDAHPLHRQDLHRERAEPRRHRRSGSPGDSRPARRPALLGDVRRLRGLRAAARGEGAVPGGRPERTGGIVRPAAADRGLRDQGGGALPPPDATFARSLLEAEMQGRFRRRLLPHHAGQDSGVRRSDVGAGRAAGIPAREHRRLYPAGRAGHQLPLRVQPLLRSRGSAPRQSWPAASKRRRSTAWKQREPSSPGLTRDGSTWPTGAPPIPRPCRRRSRTSSIPTGYSIPASCALGRAK